MIHLIAFHDLWLTSVGDDSSVHMEEYTLNTEYLNHYFVSNSVPLYSLELVLE